MIALMKSFGAKRRFILQTITIQLTMIGLTGVILGSIMGFIVENLVANLIADLFMSELPSPTLQTLFIGLLATFILLPGFAFSLLQLSNTSAIKVLRKMRYRLHLQSYSLLEEPSFHCQFCSIISSEILSFWL